mmetsp:Transcript_7583/g.19733  ORF Transcript_7583/g.19733 Transcript_7583/m.19733 type:complete len:201 (-) Transcript_7583:669-1271(-)
MFCFVTPIRHVGHCLVPVSSIHCCSKASSFLAFLLRAPIFSACSWQVSPLCHGCAPQRRHEDFPHCVHFSFGSSPSSSATRIGQFGVGHAQRSATDETACSKLRASNRSSSSPGTILLRSRSASGARHCGQVTLAAPTERRASVCLTMQREQYQPWSQPSRTACCTGTSLQQIWQSSGRSFSRIECGLDEGLTRSLATFA